MEDALLAILTGSSKALEKFPAEPHAAIERHGAMRNKNRLSMATLPLEDYPAFVNDVAKCRFCKTSQGYAIVKS